MDPTAALIAILHHLCRGDRQAASYDLMSLAETLTLENHNFMPDVDEAIETFQAGDKS